MEVDNITPVPTYTVNAPLPTFEDYGDYRDTHTPLVIDNGASTLRYGFATSATPRSGTNVVAKYKERKGNKPILVFGDAVEVDTAAKSQIRYPWEGDVLLNFDALENALDYVFVTLGIDAPTVDHPVLMTERLASPLHSRALTSELMFELYNVPSLAYCVDSVMSFYQNNLPQPGTAFNADGLVVSFNTSSTSVVPILSGKGIMSQAKRIPYGASQASEYLHKLVQMKYPTFPTRLTPVQSNWMLRTFCSFSSDYQSLLRTLKDPLALRSAECAVQFPFSSAADVEKTEEELNRIAERKREQGRKLQEMAAKARVEKLAQKESDLQYMLELKKRRDTQSKREWQNTLQSEGFENDNILEKTIKKLEDDVKKARKKEANEPDDPEPEEPSFPLVEVPDADLDEEQLKEKRRQKLMKAGHEARIRAKREKEREKEEREAQLKQEEDERERDLEGWAHKLRREHDNLLMKLKERARRRTELTDRKSAAAQARMKNIASLAADESKGKKRRKAGGEDMFGADDADWAIYRKINIEAASSDEEEDFAHLQDVEQKLLAYDPSFTAEHTHASLSSQRSALISAFKPEYDEGDYAGKARIHLTTERWRVCEAWFAPSMAGVDSAGLAEVMQNVLAAFSESERARLVKNVFATGGPSHLPGLEDRLFTSLRPILPPETPLSVSRAAEPTVDAWKGMAAFARTDDFKRAGVTRAEYDEMGGERIKRWWGGNWNLSFAS